MNGDELLAAFLKFVQEQRPARFFNGKDVPERPHCYYEWRKYWNKRVFLDLTNHHLYFESDCEPCKLRMKPPEIKAEYITEGCYGAYDAVLFISINGQIEETIPIEAKGNTDALDDRLREQIFIAVKNFGQSLLLLDNEQACKAKKHNLQKYLPCEIWFFNGKTFEQMTEQIVRYNSSGEPKISKRAIEKATDIHEPAKLRVLQRKFLDVISLIDALTYNQWNWKDERKFTREESQLFYELIGEPIVKHRCHEVEEKTIRITKTLMIERTEKTVQKSLFEKQFQQEA
jgi:hypothetical protein